MTVLDTHAWIWWRSDSSRLGRRAKKEIDGARRLGISTIRVWELSMLVRKNPLELDRDLLEWAEGAAEVLSRGPDGHGGGTFSPGA